jgi:Zn-finger nucleic acid-binding protein
MDPAPPAKCPRCRNVPLGDEPLIRHCGRCKGSWIAEETLHARVAAAPSTHPGLTWHTEARAALMCAICAEPMETLVVRDTAVDRCAQHGIWFDANELAHVLAPVAAAAYVAAAEPHRSTTGELAEDGIELAVDVADVAVEATDAADVLEVGGSVVEVGSTIVETGGGVFEVLIDGAGVAAEAVVDVIAALFSALD